MAKEIKMIERLAYRVPEAAAALGVSRSTLYAMISAGEIRKSKIGGTTVIPAEELRRLLAPAAEAA